MDESCFVDSGSIIAAEGRTMFARVAFIASSMSDFCCCFICSLVVESCLSFLGSGS
jgi:hypothetical protein